MIVADPAFPIAEYHCWTFLDQSSYHTNNEGHPYELIKIWNYLFK